MIFTFLLNPESIGLPENNGKEVTKRETLHSQAQCGWSSLNAGLSSSLSSLSPSCVTRKKTARIFACGLLKVSLDGQSERWTTRSQMNKG